MFFFSIFIIQIRKQLSGSLKVVAGDIIIYVPKETLPYHTLYILVIAYFSMLSACRFQATCWDIFYSLSTAIFCQCFSASYAYISAKDHAILGRFPRLSCHRHHLLPFSILIFYASAAVNLRIKAYFTTHVISFFFQFRFTSYTCFIAEGCTHFPWSSASTFLYCQCECLLH